MEAAPCARLRVIAFPPTLGWFVLLAIAGAMLGVWMTEIPQFAQRLVPLSGGVLILIAIVWVWPEVAEIFGWLAASALMLSGFAMLWAVNRFIYPVCPSCSHTHSHDACQTKLHGFAAPLIAAALIHGLFDGWVFGTAQTSMTAGHALSVGVWLHRLPESMAFGVILKSAVASRRQAILWIFGVQIVVVIGAFLALSSASYLGVQWITFLLAMGGGTFLYLGYHAWPQVSELMLRRAPRC